MSCKETLTNDLLSENFRAEKHSNSSKTGSNVRILLLVVVIYLKLRVTTSSGVLHPQKACTYH